MPLDAEHLRRLASDVSAMTDALCELRAGGRGVTPQVNTHSLRDFVQQLRQVEARRLLIRAHVTSNICCCNIDAVIVGIVVVMT